MLFTRKSPDSNQRRQASKVSDSIASVLHDHLSWKRYGNHITDLSFIQKKFCLQKKIKYSMIV